MTSANIVECQMKLHCLLESKVISTMLTMHYVKTLPHERYQTDGHNKGKWSSQGTGQRNGRPNVHVMELIVI